jgi:hypothetical protein
MLAPALFSDALTKSSASSLVHLTPPRYWSTRPVIPGSARNFTTSNTAFITGALVESVVSRSPIRLMTSFEGLFGSVTRGITISTTSGGGCGCIVAIVNAAGSRMEKSPSSRSVASRECGAVKSQQRDWKKRRKTIPASQGEVRAQALASYGYQWPDVLSGSSPKCIFQRPEEREECFRRRDGVRVGRASDRLQCRLQGC